MTPATAPDPAATDTATAVPSDAPPPTILPSEPPTGIEETIEGAESIKQAVTERNLTVGEFIERLDAVGVTLGDTRFSLWSVLVVLLVIIGVVVFARIATSLGMGTFSRLTRLDATQRLLGEKLLSMAIWAFAILIGIDILGIDLTALAVFSGAFGLAVGFGLQKTFGNLIAGLILLMDRSIKPGDVIAVSDQAGTSTFGQIRKIGIRAVSVTTRDQREYLIPNEQLMINQVENWSYSSRDVRIQVRAGISYTCDMDKAEELMLEAAKSAKRVLSTPPPTVWLEEFGESSVNFIIHCWIRDPEEGVGNVRSEVLKNLWRLFQENGVEIPFPQRDLNLRDNLQFQQLIAAISQRAGTEHRPSDEGI
ncbi:mechanosensitive ion channel family protein [Altericroceibacterium xinjiangense]|uniref:mechanosensitive ion channel family protein n=1 Tax=Altericroceibacterium xinjiangense TaxID=762261 RepID=UPI000F7EA0D0|nr:mechanosensitive ion channel domain-containing protein [Altericroceibacterium xinjiangense]